MIKASLSNLTPFTKLLLILAVVVGLSSIFTLVFIVLAIPFTGITALKALVSGAGASIAFLKYIQAVQSISIFIIPSIAVAWLFSNQPWRWMGFKKTKLSLILISALIFIVCQPFVAYLAKINAELTLPEYLAFLEVWMKNTESTINQLVFQFLDTKSVASILSNLVIFVVIPALGEEMLFRGAIQPVIAQWTKSRHWAVWITAFLFSAMHLQFFTFLPRFFLGIMLGYLLVYGKNIWYPVVGHFMNNLLSLVIFYYYRAFKPDINPMEIEAAGYATWMVLVSIIVFTGCMLLLKREAKSEDEYEKPDYQET